MDLELCITWPELLRLMRVLDDGPYGARVLLRGKLFITGREGDPLSGPPAGDFDPT